MQNKKCSDCGILEDDHFDQTGRRQGCDDIALDNAVKVLPVIVYTDGACSANGKATAVGGWAFIVVNQDETKWIKSGWSPTPVIGATNNTMEASAVLEALKWITLAYGAGQNVEIKTDSQLVIGWFAKGWKRNLEHLRPTLAEIDAELAKHKVKFTWVKAHSGLKWNEAVDQLAVKAGKGTVVTVSTADNA
jgi:ribonuclease HI